MLRPLGLLVMSGLLTVVVASWAEPALSKSEVVDIVEKAIEGALADMKPTLAGGLGPQGKVGPPGRQGAPGPPGDRGPQGQPGQEIRQPPKALQGSWTLSRRVTSPVFGMTSIP